MGENQSTGNLSHDLQQDMLVRSEYMGVESLLNPWASNTSSQRAMMFASHLGQTLVLDRAENPKVATGFEGVVGKYPFRKLNVNEDIQVVNTISRFKNAMLTRGSNPALIVVYIGLQTGRFGYFELTNYTKTSDGFGYRNVWKGAHLRRKDAFIPKDSDFQFSTAPNQDGNVWKYGTNLNVMFSTDWTVTEDACKMSERGVQKLSHTALESCTIRISKDQLPLNLYGDDSSYKVIPDINEKVRNDGILAAVRRVDDPAMFAYDYTDQAMMPQPHDDLFEVPPGATVTNVKTYIGFKGDEIRTNDHVFEQIFRYNQEHIQFYLDVIRTYNDLVSQGYTPDKRMSSLVEHALLILYAENTRNRVPMNQLDKTFRRTLIGYMRELGTKRVALMDQKELIDGVKLEVEFMYPRKPQLGHKLTGRDGAKGVISEIVPTEHMPVDDWGNRADLIIAEQGGLNRMNTGQFNEQHIGRVISVVENEIRNATDDTWGCNRVLEFLNDIWPRYADLVATTYQTDTEEGKVALAEDVRENGIQLVMPPFLNVNQEDLTKKLTDKYNIQRTPVTFYQKGTDGDYHPVRTENSFLIGSKYILLLCKIPELDISGVSLSYLSQFQIPCRPRPLQKHMEPMKKTPIRFGEDEVALMIMSVGSEQTARFMGLNGGGSPQAVEALSEKLLTDTYPTQLGSLDWSTEDIIRTNNQVRLLHHMFGVTGIKFEKSEGE